MTSTQLALSEPAPFSPFAADESGLRGGMRSSLRLARISMFLAETFTRHALDGVSASAPEAARELRWICENLSALSGVRPQVLGALPTSPCVIVANHVSYLDPAILAGLVPCVPIAKAELRDWPVLGDAARRSKVLFVRRECPMSGARVLREAKTALEQGISVLVFPEGTTTRGSQVLPFRRGAFGLARLLDVPIVPVAIEYAEPEAAWVGDETFLPHFARTLARPFTRATLRFLPSIAADRDRSATELTELARTSIARALEVKSRTPHVTRHRHAQLAVA